MRAGLGFAVAADTNPDILLIDEVFAVGDERFRPAQGRIESFFKAAIVIVSHGMELLKRYCTQVVAKEGQIVEDGAQRNQNYLQRSLNS